MRLRNNFTDKTRLLFFEKRFRCMDCKNNGQDGGGITLHHIKGRESKSAFNCIALCGGCHGKCGHSQEEESKYAKITAEYLWKAQHYTPTEEDKQFLYDNRRLYDNP